MFQTGLANFGFGNYNYNTNTWNQLANSGNFSNNAQIQHAYFDPEGINSGLSNINPNLNTSSNTSTTGSGLSNIAGIASAGTDILQGMSGLASAYTAYKGLQLAKDQFRYQKGLANRNLANQSKIINNSYDNAAQVAAGMIGGGSYNPATDSQGNYGMTDQAIVDRYAQKAKEQHVDGSPV